MYFPTAVVAFTSLLSVVSAQTYYPANPDEIDLGTKQTWCSNQVSSCTLLCLDQQSGGGFTNECDPETLQYQCICADNTSPNATEYSQTIPYFICTYQVQNCVQNCGQYDPNCAEVCATGRVCGASNPTRGKTSTGSNAATKTSAGNQPTASNGDDVAFDAATTGSGASQTGASGDDPAATDGSSSTTDKSSTPNAGNKLSSVSGGVYASSVMILSVLCGAFVFQL
ncbi:hypothetical protein H072_5327 [Dactylellina haptotyla CBS 200.50]|uniref:DUF7707 domain-containing protein n=1 Tax=Dactylellina haptotyla (strain CBS 200.50) TaxID=1284197 RepID=S8BZG8_DACHA|nr:hypothetical protein H072_5327 [Dactylellina haptotyla CBS 200.50]